MMQVVAGPIIQVMEEEIELNKKTLMHLEQEKKQLMAALHDNT